MTPGNNVSRSTSTSSRPGDGYATTSAMKRKISDPSDRSNNSPTVTSHTGGQSISSYPPFSPGGRSTSSWTGTTAQSKKNKEPKMLRTSKSVFVGRYIFILMLIVASAALGYISYYLILLGEKRLAKSRFDSITERALSIAQLVVEEKKKATDSLALMAGVSNPSADQWPNVYMVGYKQIAQSLGIVTEGSLSLCPLVKPGGQEQAEFEEFAYNYYTQVEYPEYADQNKTGFSAFGFGIFSYGSGPHGNLSYADGRFHIQSNWTYYYSQQDVLVPYLQSDFDDPSPVLLLNVHGEHHRGKAIDSTIECSKERAAAGDYTRECASITDLMWSETNAKDVEAGPAGLYMVPIYPMNDNTTLTGFIVGKQIWADLLKHGFESDVSGLKVVLRTSSNSSHTYRVDSGELEYVGPGVWPDEAVDSDDDYYYATSHINPNYFSNTTIEYYMDIYSTQEFTNIYATNNAYIACVGAVCIMLGTALLFFAYDYFVRKEFHSKKKLLEAKRQFVRFVSHEVRTPLNTVCMGLTLLQHELHTVLGRYDSSSASGDDKDDKDESTNNNEQVQFRQRVQEWTELTHQVYQNADAAVNVMSDLLNYDKVQMGTLTLELSLLNIYNAIEKTVAEFKIASVEKKVNLQLDLKPLLTLGQNADSNDEEKPANLTTGVSSLPDSVRDCRVVGDPVRLAQVFRNLISNGLKFSNEGGNLTIRVSEKPFKRNKKFETVILNKHQQNQDEGDGDDNGISLSKRGFVEIEVIDEGVGMTTEQLRTVFDDGTQFNVNKFQAGGGSGLGLSIAKGIIEKHNGTLTCSSFGLGHGTTFKLSLPLYDNPAGCVSPTNGLHDIDETETALFGDSTTKEMDPDFEIPKLNILVVDDATTNRKLCIRLLERSGHTCHGACNGKEAVDMVKKTIVDDTEQPYDCILMDHEMPVMTGPEATSAMRKMGCSAYIVGVTGNVMSEDVEHFHESGANSVLPKPFRLEALENCWVEDGVTHFESKAELEATGSNGGNMIRVESGGDLSEMDDELMRSIRSNT